MLWVNFCRARRCRTSSAWRWTARARSGRAAPAAWRSARTTARSSRPTRPCAWTPSTTWRTRRAPAFPLRSRPVQAALAGRLAEGRASCHRPSSQALLRSLRGSLGPMLKRSAEPDMQHHDWLALGPHLHCRITGLQGCLTLLSPGHHVCAGAPGGVAPVRADRGHGRGAPGGLPGPGRGQVPRQLGLLQRRGARRAGGRAAGVRAHARLRRAVQGARTIRVYRVCRRPLRVALQRVNQKCPYCRLEEASPSSSLWTSTTAMQAPRAWFMGSLPCFWYTWQLRAIVGLQ